MEILRSTETEQQVVSVAQKLPGRNGSFFVYFVAFSVSYLALYMSDRLHRVKQNVTT